MQRNCGKSTAGMVGACCGLHEKLAVTNSDMPYSPEHSQHLAATPLQMMFHLPAVHGLSSEHALTAPLPSSPPGAVSILRI